MTTTVRESTDLDAVRDTLATFYTAWAAQDADAIAALYVEDATVVQAGSWFRGRTAIRDFFTAGFAGRLAGSRGIDTPLDVRVIDGHTAVVISSAGILMAGEQRVPAERERTSTWVLSKQDGQWLVVAFSSTPAH
jgi:uncharacterized protein (TIGR02246 family)